MFLRIFLLVSFVFQGGIALADDCQNYQEQLRWHSTLKAHGPGYESDFPTFRAHAKIGSFIYSVTSDSMLAVSDVSQPDSPHSVTEVNLGIRGYLALSKSSTIIVASYEPTKEDESSLLGFDVQNPEQPILVQKTPLPAPARSFCFQNDKLLVALSDQTLAIYELTGPGTLVHVNTLDFTDSIDELATHQGLVYVGMSEQMLILDLSDSFNPVEVNSLTGYGFRMDFPDDFSGDTMLLYNDGYLRTYDVSNPLNLEILDEVSSPYSIWRMAFQDGSAIIQTDIVTFFYPLSPAGEFGPEIPVSYEYSNALSVFSDQDFLYYCTDLSISLLAKGAGQPAIVSEAVQFPDYQNALDVEVKENYAFVALGDHGLLTYDLSDWQQPQWAGSGFIPHSIGKIVIQDNWAFAIGGDGTTVVDITDPTLPQTRSTIPGPADYSSIISATIDNGQLFIDRPYQGFEIVDVSDPVNLSSIFSWEPGFLIEDMEAVDGLLHVVDSEGYYRVFRTDVLPPLELASLQVSNATSGLSIQSGMALIGCGYFGATLVDFENPDNLTIVSQTHLPGFARDVLLLGEVALIGSDFSTQILDISIPEAPRMQGSLWAQSRTPLVMENGTFVMWSWMENFQTAPASCEMLSPVQDIPTVQIPNLAIYPNPFNPRTTVGFSLPESANVELSVYDLKGQCVRHLIVSETLPAGTREVAWNGKDDHGRSVASGVYLVRLEAGAVQVSGRMALLR